MALTALQRTFLIDNLGVKPNRKLLDVSGKITDKQLKEAVDDYLRIENTILSQIKELRTMLGADPLVLNLERAMTDIQKNVKAARRDGGLKIVEGEAKTVAKLQALSQRAIDNKDFYASLDTGEKALKALRSHPQRDHVAGEIGIAAPALQEARRLIGEGNVGEARRQLNTGLDACREGDRCATEYAAVMVVKAEATRILGATKGQIDKDDWKDARDEAKDAADLAEPPTRDYAEAKRRLRDVIAELKTELEDLYVSTTNGDPEDPNWITLAAAGDEPDDLKELRANRQLLAANSGGATIVDEDLVEIGKIRKKAQADIAAGNYGNAVLAMEDRHYELVRNANKIAVRRLKYDEQRATTTTDIDSLDIAGPGGKKLLVGQMFSLRKLVESADGLASRKTLRIEEGIEALKQVSATCNQLLRMANDITRYLTKRSEAEDKLNSLREGPVADAGVIDDQLTYIDRLMGDAAKATGIIDAKKAIVIGVDMEDRKSQQVDWAKAVTIVEQAVQAMTAAEALAQDLGEATNTAIAAKDADDLPKIQKAVEDLRKQKETAEGKDHKDKAAHEFQQMDSSLDEALREAEGGRIEIARTLLDGAASLLLGAKTIQFEYGSFVAERKKVDDRLKLLLASTTPPAAKLESKTKPIEKLLEQADKLADDQAWEKANDSLRAALAAVVETEEAAKQRKLFDERVTRLTNDANALSNPLKGEVTGIIGKAGEKADAFNFVHASRFLDNATARIASAKVMEKALAGDIGDDFQDAVNKMLLAKGGEELFDRPTDNPSGGRAIPNGPELLDELVKNLPKTVPVKVIMELAKKRFGVTMEVSALERQGDDTVKEFIPASPDYQEPSATLASLSKRTKTAKKMYEMLALTPENSKNNPSMTLIKRSQAMKTITFDPTNSSYSFSTSGGGAYSEASNRVTMKGRPGDKEEKFGRALIDAGALPEPESAVYAPVDDSVIDAFEFANVHETGHSVDDRMGFMMSHMGQPAYGNWLMHSGDLKPIIDQVMAKHGGTDDDDLLRQYVSDLLGRAKPTVPAVALDGQVAMNKACADVDDWYDIATNGDPWDDQGKSRDITMPDGRVYQLAYTDMWVSYPFSERAKGITSYQFRSHAEWFAELFAAYAHDKLKPRHPARKWLSSLSL